MSEISIKANIEAVSRALDDFRRRQLPFATAQAINDTLFDVKANIRQSMLEVFAQPVARTLNSVRISKANKQTLTGRAWIDDEPNKGTPPATYLTPEVFGGPRNPKRFEKALRFKGVMPPGTYAVPAEGVTMSGPQIVQLLSYFNAFPEQGYRANMTGKRRAKLAGKIRSEAGYIKIGGFMYFAANGKSPRTRHLAPGIYRKSGTHGADIKPVFLFVRQPQYQVRLPFVDIAERTARTMFNRHLGARLARAIASSRQA